MARLFMPSCKVPRYYPQASARLLEYLRERGYAERLAGCCLPDHPAHRPTAPEDELTTICLTCTALSMEQEEARVIHALDIILQDPHFPYPDLGGEEMAVQDCWRAQSIPGLYDTVRALARKMHIVPVELPRSREESRFCGLSLHADINPVFSVAAPCFAARAARDGVFVPIAPEAALQAMQDHAASIPTARVLTYCGSCDAGLRAGGADSVGILNLLFGAENTLGKL